MKAGKFPLLYPTGSFAALLFVLGAMWYAASSQNSPAVYLLLFGLTAVFLVSIPHTLLNLTNVTIAPESAKPAFAGEEVSLPVEIMNCSRITRRGIELVLPGSGGERKRVDYIPAGKAARVTLRFPAGHRGERRVGTFRLTSIYPLGFVRVLKRFASSQTYLVYPKPSGDPRLPVHRARSPHSRPQTELGEGDDFAGVRAYVPGESQRHIDWRAVARGQPLMTKQFAAEAEGSVRLDFSALRFLGIEERLSQLALWVIEAERVRRPYSLRLPNTDIAPAVGEAHFHRCLRELSLFEVGTPRRPRSAGVGAARRPSPPGSTSMSKSKSSRRTQPWRDTAIPRLPLLWLAAALLFTLPPMFGTLAGWAPSFFLLALAMKFWMEPRGYRLRSIVLKLILAAVTVGAIFLSYGTLKGVEPAVSLLAVLVSLKILEAHTAREFQVMVMMAWVLCLCGFLLSQDLAIGLCLFVAFALLIAALVQFHRGSPPGAFWLPLATTFKLLAQAAPLVVLLFLLFPRINTGFTLRIGDLRGAMTGFSDQLSPGGIAALANSTNIAFRAEFPDRRTGPVGPMYWRGLVMWHCEGMEWRGPYAPTAISDSSRRYPARDKTIRQRITIPPHSARWMFALDRPLGSPSGAMLARGNYLYSFQLIRKTRRYEVLSSIEPIEKQLDAYERRQALQLPKSISPAVRELAASFAAHDSEPRATVHNALQFFRTQGFRYSLTPGEYNKNDLEEFLFHRRTGFCGHYAASFATLMRLAGIPARVVVGYLGGEYNDLGGFFLVHQADTHAWCEVWIPENGWTRIDPTSVVAPGRASQDLSSFLAGRVASGEMATGRSAFVTQLTRLALVNQIRSIWEALNYQWDTRVMGFDADVQDVLLTSLGLTNRGPLPLVMQVLIVIAAVLSIYAGWMQLRTRPRADRIQALYERFCRKLTRIGVQRDPWEGPSDFATRAAQSFPNESECVRRIIGTYIALRYAPRPAATNLHEFAKEVDAFTAHR